MESISRGGRGDGLGVDGVRRHRRILPPPGVARQAPGRRRQPTVSCRDRGRRCRTGSRPGRPAPEVRVVRVAPQSTRVAPSATRRAASASCSAASATCRSRCSRGWSAGGVRLACSAIGVPWPDGCTSTEAQPPTRPRAAGSPPLRSRTWLPAGPRSPRARSPRPAASGHPGSATAGAGTSALRSRFDTRQARFAADEGGDAVRSSVRGGRGTWRDKEHSCAHCPPSWSAHC